MRASVWQWLTVALLSAELCLAQSPFPGAPGTVESLTRPNFGAGQPPANALQGRGPAASAATTQLQRETGFSGGPTKALMYTYIPQSFRKGNPVVVALHHCQGTGPGYFGEYPWRQYADQKGFMMIFASSPGENGSCWDVSSNASLKHDGGGDTQSIVEMVKYAVAKYGCSKQHVFAVGHSSGAMLTQALGASYPDVFAAGAAYSGVPAGCFSTGQATGAGWNSQCAQGMIILSPEAWGKKAKDMYPTYNGPTTRMMLVHGTADATINFKDHGEAVKQWTYLHHLNADNPSKKYTLPSQSNYEVSEYGSSVLAIAANGVTHDNPAKLDLTYQFFGI